MRTRELGRLLTRDLRRTRGALATAGFGIVVGTAALVFFLSLGLGVRTVLLGDVFPLDKIELEPRATSEPGLLALVLGGPSTPRIAPETVDQLRGMPEVKHVYPKLRFAFPSSARGGQAILGREVGTSEMVGDGVDPALVTGDVHPSWTFEDPWQRAEKPCSSDRECSEEQYCEYPSNEKKGKCADPVPVLMSRYLVEMFNKGIAPAHGLPPVGAALLERASGVTFTMRLGESLLGSAKQGNARTVQARVVGISSRAIDIGITLPIETVRRWNTEYGGEEAGRAYTSLLLEMRTPRDGGKVIDRADKLGLVPKDTRARDVSVLINGVTALLSLVASVILLMAGSNIAYTFRALLKERRVEIGLYRAVGASRGDILLWQLSLAALVGAVHALVGVGLGWVATHLADWLASTHLPEFPFKPESFFAFPWWLLFGAVGFGSLFSLLGALGPARRAASEDPREGLLG